MASETAKLPPGQSYPLKPSVLAAALADAQMRLDVHLIRKPGDLFDAHFWPPNENVPYERLYLRAGSVPVERAAEARSRVEAVMVPRLVHWIGEIMSSHPQSSLRRERQYLNFGPP